MADTRKKNTVYNCEPDTWDSAQLAVLMDIRDELQVLNLLLGCANFLRIPSVLESIRRNTATPRKSKT